MGFRFKVGDKVKVLFSPTPDISGKEGIVTQLGGCSDPTIGAVVTNEDFPSGDDSYGEHGIWFPDAWLELV